MAAPTGPVTFGTDTFTRTSASGWGTADLGGAWGLSGSAALFTVQGDVGGSASRRAPRRGRGCRSGQDVDVSASVALDHLSDVGIARSFLAARTVGTTTDYYLNVRYAVTGAVSLQLQRRIAGVETTLASATLAGHDVRAGAEAEPAVAGAGCLSDDAAGQGVDRGAAGAGHVAGHGDRLRARAAGGRWHRDRCLLAGLDGQRSRSCPPGTTSPPAASPSPVGPALRGGPDVRSLRVLFLLFLVVVWSDVPPEGGRRVGTDVQDQALAAAPRRDRGCGRAAERRARHDGLGRHGTDRPDRPGVAADRRGRRAARAADRRRGVVADGRRGHGLRRRQLHDGSPAGSCAGRGHRPAVQPARLQHQHGAAAALGPGDRRPGALDHPLAGRVADLRHG